MHRSRYPEIGSGGDVKSAEDHTGGKGVHTIGILTGGGDCPGLNAAIRAVVLTGQLYGYSVIGIRNGWQGLLNDDMAPLSAPDVSGIISRGGTILGTSRTDPLKDPAGLERIRKNMKNAGIGTLVVIGGNGTLSAASDLYGHGIPIVGVPKTIDNDVAGTDRTFGFDTAVSIVTDAIDRLQTTAESHHRIMVVEVMGRDAGWIALEAGIAGGADEILVPEVRFTMDEVCANLKARYNAGKKYSVVVVAEGTHHEDIAGVTVPACDRDECGHEKFVGVGNLLARELESRLQIETRVTVPGYVQRGGTPAATDRVLATRFGVAAVEQVRDGNFGCMVALQGARIGTVPLKEVASRIKTVDFSDYALAKKVM
jgi:phosphofructokinase-like protein